MRDKFLNWLVENKRSITRPTKYVDTINTISRNLEKKTGTDRNIYSIRDQNEAVEIKELYFSYEDLYAINQRGNHMYSRSFDLYIEFLSYQNSVINDPILDEVLKDNELTSLQKETIILSRVGQGKYRESLIKMWRSCAISKFDDTRILVASHIKPWRVSTNMEKIDEYNGLLLLPTYDKLFDIGFISFDEKGDIKISSQITDLKRLSLTRNVRIEIKPKHMQYLEYHRENIFKS